MRKIIVLSMMTLDGVMQVDAAPGFKYGGWDASYRDQVGLKMLKKQLRPADYLLGRKTFQAWAPYWPEHGDFWPGINAGTKYILSKTVKRSDWKNSVFLKSLSDIKKLKNTKGSDLQVHGSCGLVKLLLKNDLVDELWLRIYPVTLGKGKKLFDGGAVPTAFKLIESLVTPKGVIFANYKRTGKIKPTTLGA
jgi:dihydrofolate reductase